MRVGYGVIGLENDMRARFFRPEANISDFSDFGREYPEFEPTHGVEDVLREIHHANAERWSSASVPERGGCDDAAATLAAAASLSHVPKLKAAFSPAASSFTPSTYAVAPSV